MKRHFFPSSLPLGIGIFFVVVCFSLCAESATYVVVDTDGSVEDYAALTVLSRMDVSTANAVRIVSVHNAGWGYAASSSETLKRFMNLLKLPNAVVTIGALQTLTEASNREHSENMFTAPAGSCSSSQGFPAIPFDAASRQMPFSRADVSFAFAGASNTSLLRTLPLLSLESSTPTQTTYAALTQLISSCQRDVDSIVYLQFGPASTLASIMKQWQEESPTLLNKFLYVAKLHMMDSGYAGGVDNEAMQFLLSSGILGRLQLPAQMYTTSFFTPSIGFTEAKWNAFGEAAQSSSSLAVSWLYSAWAAKRSMVHSTPSFDFFSRSTLASTLVVLCAVSEHFRESLCSYYAAPAIELQLLYTLTLSVNGLTGNASNPFNQSFSERIAGDNVTSPYHYQGSYSVSPANVAEAGHLFPQVVYTTGLYSGAIFSPSTVIRASEDSLADVFWNTWFSLLY